MKTEFHSEKGEPSQAFGKQSPRSRSGGGRLNAARRRNLAPPKRKTILVLDDDAAIRLLNATVLDRLGYEVLEAAAPTDALSVFESHPGEIHLLISDVDMPEMTGPEVVSRLLGKRTNVRVLYVSGSSWEELLRLNIGETPVLHKPYTIDDLSRKVHELLDGAGEKPKGEER